MLFIAPDKEITAMTRHNTDHKMWAPTAASNAPFKALPGDGWYVIETEVLNNKVPGIKDTHYIFDIMVADGEYLLDKTFEERIDLLKSLFLQGGEPEEYSHYKISENVQLAKTFTDKFRDRWNEADRAASESDGAPLDEGLVLKNPTSYLKMPTKQKANTNWMVKCRVSHKNYTF